MQDDNIIICAGVRSTEHWGEKSPFDPEAQSHNERATHAGSVSYIVSKSSYIVMCEASTPDSNGITHVTCHNLAGNELAVIQLKTSDNIAMLHAMIAMTINETSHLQMKLLAPGGTLLSGMPSVAVAFFLATHIISTEGDAQAKG